MSYETWKAEFYPVHAKEVHAAQAVEHSLQKWIGLRPENLKRHGVHTVGFRVFENEHCRLGVNAYSCSLCEVYMDDEAENPLEECGDCPLVKVRGTRCDNTYSGQRWSPYGVFGIDANPEPMIELLQRAKEYESESPRNRKES